MDEVAFEINYELRPSADTDPNELTAGTGEYDEESGWVINKSNLGILTPTNLAEGEEGPKYKIRDFGTGW